MNVRTTATPATTPTRHRLPPGMRNQQILNGFDAASWQFRNDPIFSLTYEQANLVTLPPEAADSKDFDVPDGMSVEPIYRTAGTEAMVFSSSHSEDEDRFAMSIEASLSVKGGGSGSASFAMAKFSSVIADKDSTSIIISSYKANYTFRRASSAQSDATLLTAEFRAALAALPATYTASSADNVKAFVDFFKKWGTHYLKVGQFGGNWMMQTVITGSGLDTLNTLDIKSSVQAGFDEGIASGSLKTSVESNTKSRLNLQGRTSRTVWSAIGGDSGQEREAWLKSVDVAPQFLMDVLSVATEATRPVFGPIYELQSDAGRQTALQQAWAKYPPRAKQAETALPGVSSPQLRQNLQADTDGFLSAIISSAADDDHGWLTVSTDSSNQPTKQRGGASMHRYGKSQVIQSSLFTPVRAKDYYRVDNEFRHGTPQTRLAFQPFSLDLGAWTDISIGNVFDFALHTAETDGFVVATIEDSGQNGNRGFVTGMQVPGNANLNDAMLCGGAAIHWYDGHSSYLKAQSFCMAVPKGNKFSVRFVPTSFTPKVTACWVPMGAAYKMLPVASIAPDTINKAETNGILMGSVEAIDNSRGAPIEANSSQRLRLEVSTSQDFATPVVVGKTAAQYSLWYDKHLQYGSCAAIVTKGSWYRAGTELVGGVTQPRAYWVGIVPA